MILFAGPDGKHEAPIEISSWETVETAIRQLDGHNKTEMSFGNPSIGTPPASPYMAIRGGPDRYFVYVTFDDSRFQSLCRPDNPPGKFDLNVGGQKCDFDAKVCVELELVLRGARVFLEECRLDSSLKWIDY